MYETRCLWRSRAALGGPVVPLVKRRIAIWSGSIGQVGSPAEPALARSRNRSRLTTVVPGSFERASARSLSVTR